VVIP